MGKTKVGETTTAERIPNTFVLEVTPELYQRVTRVCPEVGARLAGRTYVTPNFAASWLLLRGLELMERELGVGGASQPSTTGATGRPDG